MSDLRELMPIISLLQEGCQNPKCPRYRRHGSYAVCGKDGCVGFDEDQATTKGGTMSGEPTTNPMNEMPLIPGAITETPAAMMVRLGDDAAKWAAEFRQTAIKLGYSDMDEGWLIGWFANAIEHSNDVRRWKREQEAAAKANGG